MRMIALTLLTAALASGCAVLKPYEKEYLLNPAMDDDRLSSVEASLMTSATAAYEKLGKSGSGAGGGSACPTCGG